jgi:glycine betaine/proline transport system substrate-binding protein
MAALVDIDGLSHEEAATKWLADNEATWKSWL